MPILKVSHQGETFPFHAVAAGPEAGYIAPTTALLGRAVLLYRVPLHLLRGPEGLQAARPLTEERPRRVNLHWRR